MDGKRLIRSIKLTNLLSFGPKGEEVELEPLNVLIGPNASGKSNFVEALAVLYALPTDLAAEVRRCGGIGELIWKGGDPAATAAIAVTVSGVRDKQPVRYSLTLGKAGQTHRVVSELVAPAGESISERMPPYYYRLEGAEACIYVPRLGPGDEPLPGMDGGTRFWPSEQLDRAQSVLSQVRDPVTYPEITHIGDRFRAAKLYREWDFGPLSVVRNANRTDLPSDFLDEDAGNLWMVLKEIENTTEVWDGILKRLNRFWDRIDGAGFRVLVNSIQMMIRERGLTGDTPATRLSDGTLRFLCLLAILCHPEPPPLVVIEEPELGLHPDALGLVAELLVEASKRMQIIVTTHSDALVSELSDVPESVLVCERDDEGSHLRRLDKDRLKEWLEEYMLGDLWRMGKIGGNP